MGRAGVLIVLVNALAGVGLASLGIALPALGAALGTSPARVLWLVDAFLVATVCATPLTPFLLERFGARRVMLGGIAGTCVASAAAAATPSLGPLLGLAFVQGLCVAPLLPATQALVVARFPERHRAVGMALWGGGSAAGTLLGALAGGWLCLHVGWPAIFALAPALALVALPLVARAVPAEPSRAVPVDWFGLAAFGGGILALNLFLTIGDDVDWHHAPALFLLPLAAAVGLGAFLRHARRTPRPIVDLAPLANHDLATMVVLCFGIGAFSTAFFQTAMLGSVVGFDSGFLGMRGACAGAALLLGLAAAGRMLGVTRPLAVFAAGLGLLLVGKYGFTHYAPGLSPLGAIWPAAVSSVGFGVVSAVLATLAFRSLSPSQVPAAAGLFVLGQQLGYALGVAALDAFLQVRTEQLLAGGHPGAFATELAFLELFWVELAASVLLPVLVLLRRAPALAPLSAAVAPPA
ncbi:MAG: MFS transporter [bacterium]|nr:MFS transporter [bacterium]